MTFQRTKTWKETDPDFDAKLDRIEYALTERPGRTFAFDEFGPLGIRPAGGSCWARKGRPDRLPATYHRTHGYPYFHGCYLVGDDTLWGVNRRRKGIAPTWAALKSIRAAHPDGAPIYAVLVNPVRPQERAHSALGGTRTGPSCASPRRTRPGRTRSRRTSGHCVSPPSPTPASPTTPTRRRSCTDTYAGNQNARQPTSWPPNDANAPASAARQRTRSSTRC